MTKPLFTVVIPTYNRADLIPKTIGTILQQTYEDFEIVVVDDGSSDRTEDVVRSIQDPRVRYYKKANGERGAARNYGVARGNGTYINFTDSDDWVYPHHLANAVRMIERHKGPEIFHLGFERCTADGTKTWQWEPFTGSVNERLLRGNLLHTGGVFVRREVALRHGFSEDRLLSPSEDFELWLRLAARYRIFHDDAITSTLVLHEQRSMSAKDYSVFVRSGELVKKYILADETFRESFGPKVQVFTSYIDLFIAVHRAALGGDRKEAVRLTMEALRQDPSCVATKTFWATVKHLGVGATERH